VALGFAFTGLMALAAPFVGGTVFRAPELSRVLLFACIVLPFHSVAVVPLALLQRDLRLSVIVRIETIAYTFGFAAVATVLAFRGFGVWALVGGHVAEAVLVCGLSLVARPFPKRLRADRATLRELTFFGGGFAVARVANYFALAGDKWIVGRWLGQVALGLYKYAFELATLPGNLLGQVLDRVLFPAMARVQTEPVRLARAYRGGLALVGAAVLPTSAAMVVLAPEIVLTLLGPKWIAVVTPFRVLAAAALLRSGLKLTDSLVRATGAVYRRAWRQAIYAAAVMGLGLIGAQAGLVGAATGVVTGVLVGWALMMQLGLSLTGMGWREAIGATLRAAPLAVATAALASGLAAVGRGLGWPAPCVLLLAVPGAGLGAGALALAWPAALLGADAVAALRRVLGSSPGRPRLLRRLLDFPADPGVHPPETAPGA
jgi:PST family polysaccharide transporter